MNLMKTRWLALTSTVLSGFSSNILSADYQGQNLPKRVNQISTRKQLYSIEVSFRPASIFILFPCFWNE